MSNILTFDDLTTNNKALKKFVQAFTRAGAPVATIDTDGKPKRTTGVTYRELVLTFVDNQKAVFLIKQGGSIFQVKINGAVVPIKNQDDQVKAVGEIVQILDAGRAKFQAKLARQKVALPSGLKTAAPRLEVKLQEASTKLAQDIATAQARVAELKSELGEPVLDSSAISDVLDATGGKGADKVHALILKDLDLSEEEDKKSDAASRAEDAGKDKDEKKFRSEAKAIRVKILANAKKIAELSKLFSEEEWDRIISDVPHSGGTHNTIDIWSFQNLRDGGYRDDLEDRLDSAAHPDGAAALDSVELQDPNDGTEFNIELALAQAKAIIAGELMDDTHAVANLKISLSIVEQNYPIHVAEGKLDQAELELSAAESFKEAIAILEQKESA